MRTLKPSFFTNDLLAEIDPLGRLLFEGLWCLADREGRLRDRPRKIKAEVLPYDEADVDQLLEELAVRGFIIRYQLGRERFIQVVTFKVHQTPHPSERPSKIPPPDRSDFATGPEPDPIRAGAKSPPGRSHGIRIMGSGIGDPEDPSAIAVEPQCGADDAERPEAQASPSQREARTGTPEELLTDVPPTRSHEPGDTGDNREGGDKPQSYDSGIHRAVKTTLLEGITRPETPSEWGRLNNAAGQIARALAKSGVAVEDVGGEVRRRMEHYRLWHPDMPLTAMALASNWGRLRDLPSKRTERSRRAVDRENLGDEVDYVELYRRRRARESEVHGAGAGDPAE